MTEQLDLITPERSWQLDQRTRAPDSCGVAAAARRLAEARRHSIETAVAPAEVLDLTVPGAA
ncbi:MAG: hypothetical protein R2695_01505 [Acidimicrobiales bacterium]